MGGIAKSAGGFFGLSGGPQAPAVAAGNSGLNQLNAQNGIYSGNLGVETNQDLLDYAKGGNLQDSIDTFNRNTGTGGLAGGNTGEAEQEFMNALATNPLTGSKVATDQVMSNPMYSGLFGANGQMGTAEEQAGTDQSRIDDLNNQGFQLKPEDYDLYGQTSGNIARMFGSQGNQVSQDLASRGLASAPSGAAGAAFSGLAGNQNEMLAQAQQQIMQQRFQNTQQQIQQTMQHQAQQQNYASSLGNLGNSAVNNQYNRQLSGAQSQRQGLESAASLQSGQNNGTNQANMSAANFEQENKPQNMFDSLQGGVNMVMGAGGKSAGQNLGNKMFGTTVADAA